MKPDTKPVKVPVSWELAPLEWPRAAGQVETLLAALELRKKRERRKRRRTMAAAAALGLVVLLIAGGVARRGTTTLPAERDISAAARPRTAVITVPERRTLPDGSTVELRPDAELEVSYLSSVRMVRMIRGEALFDVAKDPNRPFIVAAGDIHFRAVGTSFSVGVSAHAVEMLVTEGTVAVGRAVPVPDGAESAPATASDDGTPSDASTLVSAGNRIVVERAAIGRIPVAVTSTPSETSEKLAWRVPRLEFNATSLFEIVGLLNQHSGSRITLGQTDLGRVEISGALRADNIEPLLQILDLNYQIQAVRLPDGAIELRRRP